MILPTEADNPWIWLCGMLLAGLVYLWKQYDQNRTVDRSQLVEQVQKERDRNDLLLNAIPEILATIRELKSARDNAQK